MNWIKFKLDIYLICMIFLCVFTSCFLSSKSSRSPLPSTQVGDLCYEYNYDRERDVWLDKNGSIKDCSIYDLESIFPIVDGNCKHWEDLYDVGSNDSSEQGSTKSEDSTGYKIEFHRLIIFGVLSCAKQEIFDFQGSIIVLGTDDRCLTPIKGNKEYIFEKC